MRKHLVQIWCILCSLLCLGLCGCEEVRKAEEPVGRVYQIWQSDEWRPCYLYWLAEDRLLVGSVEPPGETSQGLSYVELVDLGEGSSFAANLGYLTANWFYDVRAVEEPAAGRVYLHSKFSRSGELWVCDWQSGSVAAYETAWLEGVPWLAWLYFVPDDVMYAAEGGLWSGSFGDIAAVVSDEMFGAGSDGREGLADVDGWPGALAPTWVQLSVYGRLTQAKALPGEQAQAWQLEPPEGWLNYSQLLCLPDGESLAVTICCEDKWLLQVLDGQRQVAAQLSWDNGEDLVLLSAPDADRLLVAGKTRVELLNWRTGEIEKKYFTGIYQKLAWGCKHLAAPANLHLLLDPKAAKGFVQYAAYDEASGRLAVIKYLPEEDVSQLIVLDQW